MEKQIFTEKPGMAFLFIPMDLKKPAEQDIFWQYLSKSRQWELEDEKSQNRYIYRYITDKMNPENKDSCLYLHYHLSEAECKHRGLGANGTVFRVPQEEPDKQEKADPKEDICFRIEGIHLYTFRTKVSILALQILFARDDARYVASGLYDLKKVQRAILMSDSDTGDLRQTILEAVKSLFDKPVAAMLRYFPYLNEGTERANTMSLAFASGDNWKEELYFLKNAYRTKGFRYSSSQDPEEENLATSDDYIWGVTGENLACLIRERTEHTEHRLYERFRKEYLLTYILLLHRKFDLYKILTDFGVGEQNDLPKLKNYQNLLNSYQMDYAYERITEVPQYHRLYKKIEEQMELSQLFDDVMEPVNELSSLRMDKDEEDRNKQERKMERALAVLSFLTVFSALIDCADFLETVANDWPVWFSVKWPVEALPWLQLAASVLIVAVAWWALRSMRKKKKG